MLVRPPSDARAIAATAVGLLLVSLVALASGGSPWHAGGRQDVPVGVVSALAAAGGALVIGSLLLVWVGTPSVEHRRRRRRRLEANDLEELGAALSAGKAAALVGGAIGVFLLLVLPFLVPNATTTTPPGGTSANAVPRGHASSSAPAGHATSTALTWLVVGSAAALLLLAPAAVFVRSRRARRDRRVVVPDAAARVGSGLRRSLADLESEGDP
ncbi:MAG: hypothetical protein ACM33B_13410, partial [Pseudomonadota bacterium]